MSSFAPDAKQIQRSISAISVMPFAEKRSDAIYVLFAGCASMTLFVNPRVLFRVLVPYPFFSEIVALSVFSLLCAITLYLIAVAPKKKYSIYLLLFGVLSASRFLYAGTSYRMVLQYFPAFVGAAACAAAGFDKRFVRALLKAFAVSMLMHLVAVVAPFQFLSVGIARHSAYGEFYNEAVGILGGRASGFLTAPGVLSLYSAVGTVIGIVMLLKEKRPTWIILTASSFICGVSTTNRSYVGALVLIIIIVPLLSFRRGDRPIQAIFFTVTLGMVLVALLLYSAFGSKIEERFSAGMLEKNLEERTTGSAGVIPAFKAFLYRPIIGSMKMPQGGDRPLVFNGKQFVQVHNGFTHILATRGIFFGGVFIFWTVAAFCKLRWRIKNPTDSKTRSTIDRALFAGFLVGHAVCLVDSLLETFVMLMPLSLGLTIGQQKWHRAGLILRGKK